MCLCGAARSICASGSRPTSCGHRPAGGVLQAPPCLHSSTCPGAARWSCSPSASAEAPSSSHPLLRTSPGLSLQSCISRCRQTLQPAAAVFTRWHLIPHVSGYCQAIGFCQPHISRRNGPSTLSFCISYFVFDGLPSCTHQKPRRQSQACQDSAQSHCLRLLCLIQYPAPPEAAVQQRTRLIFAVAPPVHCKVGNARVETSC